MSTPASEASDRLDLLLAQAALRHVDDRLAIDIADAALDSGREEEVISLVHDAARRVGQSPRLWQWAGLLLRALDRRREGMAAFERAVRLAPADFSIAHGHARLALEAGASAVALFERARRLKPLNGEMLLGLAAARAQAGDLAGAIAGLEETLAVHPLWTAGQEAVAKFRWLAGDKADFLGTLDRAIAAHPQEPALWQLRLTLLTKGEQYSGVIATVGAARAIAAFPFLDAAGTAAFAELGDTVRADAGFAALAGREDLPLALFLVRHLLRTGRTNDAAARASQRVGQPGGEAFWSYLAIAWRIMGDPRLAALADSRLVRVVDLADRLPPFDRLAGLLRSLHVAQAENLHQSVRAGTQTDGALFARIEPEIEAVRAVVADAVRDHIAALPPRDPAQPTLAKRRDRPLRFSGSWSVRLTEGGYHTHHVHPQGWFSSALYVALPNGDATPHAGWLALGVPPAELGLDLAPERMIEPKPGRLVLFPSTLWHGTMPFGAGERLTVAFDVAPPLP